MSRRVGLLTALALLSLGGFAESAGAQASSSLVATVRAVGGGQVLGRVLDFGTIAGTQTVTVSPTVPEAGQFVIQGPARSNVTFTIIDLPANFGSSSLALSAWQGRHGDKSNATQGTPFTPVEGVGLDFRLSNSGLYYVHLGATLTASNAPGGTFSVPIVVNVVFQ